VSDGARCLSCGGARARPWARARDVEYRTSDEEFAYLRCEDCGALFIDPVPADRLREIYPTNYYSYAEPKGSFVHAVKAKLDRRGFRRMLASVPGDAVSVLDVGGGAGWELSALRASDGRVKETQIVDLDPAAAELARKNGHAYFCGRVEDFETDRRFSVITLLNLIEHVQDPRAVLAKVASLLAPGGIAVVKTPNHDAWDARLFKDRSWAGYHCPRHWVLFTRASFERLARASGLAVREASYTQGAPFWAASVLAWLADRGLARVTRERPVFYHPLFGALLGAFAALDFIRRPFAKTSQMFFVLERAGAVDGPGAVE
jgi:2-polyprenyl-3-methyl-5-hydroxy-6-metoxy-1,4-benzoquinol methylase